MRLLNCIAVDDEPPALEQMKEYINKTNSLVLIGLFNNGLDAIDFLQKESVDIVFLDVEMKDLNGLEVIDLLRQKPKIILTTAYDQYALKAFDLEVCDYLLKPIAFKRFIKAVNKAICELSGTQDNRQIFETQVTENKSFYIKTESKHQKIIINDIIYIEGLREYIAIHTIDGKSITLQSIKGILQKLPSEKFIRIHKSYIINIDKIELAEKHQVSINKVILPVGRTFKPELFKRINKKTI